MILLAPSGLRTWEAVAALIIAQSNGALLSLGGTSAYATEAETLILKCRTVPNYDAFEEPVTLAFEGVKHGEEWFGVALARKSSLQPSLDRLKLPFTASEGGYILLCPFSLVPEVGQTADAWRSVLRLLRAYKLPVYCMGDRGQRLDMQFQENEIVSDLTVEEKIKTIAGARLIVGVPNAWTWLATAWDKKMLLLYPADLALTRWFPYSHENIYWLQIPRETPVPLLLSGVRKLLRVL